MSSVTPRSQTKFYPTESLKKNTNEKKKNIWADLADNLHFLCPGVGLNLDSVTMQPFKSIQQSRLQ